MIERYLRELRASLSAAGVRGRPATRLLDEARDHLLEASAARGEDEAVRSFGSAGQLGAAIAAELATARTRRAAYAGFFALAPVGLTYAVLFLSFPGSHAVQESGGSVPGLGVLSFAGLIFLPQIAFVCGTLALVRALRLRRAVAVAQGELRVVRRRTGAALAAGALTLASFGAFALDQHGVVPGWWFAASLSALALAVPLGAVGAANVRASRPLAGHGVNADTAVEDVAAIVALVPGLGGVRLPTEPRRFALLVAWVAAAAVALAGVVAGDPLDGLVRALLEGVAVLACYRVLGRPLALRR